MSRDEYTPTTAFVRKHYAKGPTAYREDDGSPVRWPTPADVVYCEAQFDRWLAVVRREAKAEALREAAQIVEDTARQGGGLQTAQGAIEREADRIEKGESA